MQNAELHVVLKSGCCLFFCFFLFGGGGSLLLSFVLSLSLFSDLSFSISEFKNIRATFPVSSIGRGHVRKFYDVCLLTRPCPSLETFCLCTTAFRRGIPMLGWQFQNQSRKTLARGPVRFFLFEQRQNKITLLEL